MRINKVTIDNFRNIKHAEYDLADRNVFAGPNKQGKTNTILAIFWALTDYLMDGSSDFQSFKPDFEEQAKVSVELECDSFKLKKVYEGWRPKQRGSNELGELQHTTTYWIDDVKYASQGTAKKALAKLLGINTPVETGKFDLSRALIDPYYMGKGCEWKTFRSFIIELIGDVRNEDVLAASPELIQIKDILEKYNYDPAMTQKFVKQQIASSKKDVETTRQNVAGLRLIKDVDPSALSDAQEQIQKADDLINSLRQSSSASSNPLLAELKMDLAKKMTEKSERFISANAETKSANAKIHEEFKKEKEKLNANSRRIDELNRQRISAENKLLQTDGKIENVKIQIADLEEKRQSKLAEYHEEKDKEYTTPEYLKKVCPNCGCVLNEEDLEKDRSDWEDRKKRILDAIIRDGRDLANRIENKNFEVEDLAKGVVEAENDLPMIKQEISELEKANNDLHEYIGTLEGKLQIAPKYEEDPELLKAIDDLQKRISKLESDLSADEQERERSIAQLLAEKKGYEDIIDNHRSFLATQRKADEIETEIQKKLDALTDFEQTSILVDKFLETKLNLFAQKISSVFGDRIKFTLIKPNLKKGSWEECCYPSVLDKDTPFEDGSGSEQILAGIYLIEKVKAKLELNDLPIVFDECDKLDTQSISNIPTNAQIISTKVDDIHYDKVTLVAL